MINDTISDRAPEIYKKLFEARSECSWGHLPVNDAMFDFFESIQNYTGPVTEILEIGTNLGFSAMMQLQSNPIANLTTFDKQAWGLFGSRPAVKDRDYRSTRAAGILKLMYGNRIECKVDISSNIPKYPRITAKKYTYVFIDGSHVFEYVLKDIEISLEVLDTQYILIDNMYTPPVKKAVDLFLSINKIEEVISLDYTQKQWKDDNTEGIVRTDKITLYRKI